jgi:hypothetical protein
MQIGRDDERFLKVRRRLLETWPMIGWSLLAVIVGYTVWLFLTQPLLVNPFIVTVKLRADALPVSTMVLMSGLLPLAMLSCIVLAGALVMMMFASMGNERRYQRIIRELQERKS